MNAYILARGLNLHIRADIIAACAQLNHRIAARLNSHFRAQDNGGFEAPLGLLSELASPLDT